MQAFVLDVSACLPWCCVDEQTPFTDRLLEWAAAGSHLHVPAIWPFEIVNSLTQAVRRKRIPAERATDFLEQYRTFSFHIDPPPTVADLPRLNALVAPTSAHRLRRRLSRPRYPAGASSCNPGRGPSQSRRRFQHCVRRRLRVQRLRPLRLESWQDFISPPTRGRRAVNHGSPGLMGHPGRQPHCANPSQIFTFGHCWANAMLEIPR